MFETVRYEAGVVLLNHCWDHLMGFWTAVDIKGGVILWQDPAVWRRPKRSQVKDILWFNRTYLSGFSLPCCSWCSTLLGTSQLRHIVSNILCCFSDSRYLLCQRHHDHHGTTRYCRLSCRCRSQCERSNEWTSATGTVPEITYLNERSREHRKYNAVRILGDPFLTRIQIYIILWSSFALKNCNKSA